MTSTPVRPDQTADQAPTETHVRTEAQPFAPGTASSTLTATPTSMHVHALHEVDYSLDFVDGVYDPANTALADCYRDWGRCLMVVDDVVDDLHGEAARAYFEHHGIDLTVFRLEIDETTKTWETVESIVDAFAEFGLVRKEPVLVVGGGLATDVAGFACAAFRRSTHYIRIPTTLIGLIDASVSIKVAVNHGKYKNRLGAFHASSKVLMDFDFLRTLPTDQVRNGMAELIKITTVGDSATFDLLEKYGEELLESRFGRVEGSRPELRDVADAITYDSVRRMLELETPNLQELDLDRVIAFGHTWSPILELSPDVPFFHGHAINIDMAFSVTLAEERGLIGAGDRDRIFALMSGLGLALDSAHLTPELLERANDAILQTRDGKLRAAVPDPIGECTFLNDVTVEELVRTLEVHRERVASYPRGGGGVQAFIDGSDSAGVGESVA
ncbi:sedoheptulose 7-phosphate cyclase [Nocardioidaceae bacterium]|nr:sedoheptulose 7-phosphate cyclase [Nocardioidaceae bacterium]